MGADERFTRMTRPTTSMRHTLACAAALVAAAGTIAAQSTPAPTAWTFEAASVKPNREGGTGSSIRRQPGGRLNAVNMPLRSIITFAYQVQGFQLVNAPDWAANERYDIVAKINGDPPPTAPGTGPDPHMVAMRGLLAERFKLVVHRETREIDIYALVKARADGTLGPALKPTSEACRKLIDDVTKGLALPPTGPDAPMCAGIRQNAGRILAGGIPLTLFANGLSGQVGRFVVDRTGLAGTWDFELTFAAEPRGLLPPGQEPPPVDPSAPSLFTALQEQLGLKLDATKGPVEVLVVDSVERPVSD